MQILQMTLAFPPAYAWGGPVQTVYQSCQELVRRGHRVTVYCSNLLDKHRRLYNKTTETEVDGIRVVYFNAWNIPWWPGTLGPVWLPEIKKYLKRELKEFDVVHINGYRNIMHLPAARTARRMGVPFIVQPHGAMPIIVTSFLIKRLYDYVIGHQELKGLSALIALQESEVQQSLAHGVPRKKIEIIANGIDIDERKDLPEPGIFRNRYSIPLKQPLILFLGRINKKKGTDMLVKAFASMNSKTRAKLVIAGPDDGQLAKVKSLVHLHKLERRVTFTGLLSHKEVLEAFVDANLFVLPCRTDTFPMAMIEACLTETPMVVTDRCEIAHLVKDRVAEVVPFNPDLFAHAMEELISNHIRYEAYRTACHETLEQVFSLSAVVDKVEALYLKVISEAKNDRIEA